MKNKRNRFFAMVLTLALIIGQLSGLTFVKAESKKVYQGAGYEIVVKEQSAWDSGSVAEVTVTNVGATEIRNWEVVVAYTQGSFVNVWNATLTDGDDAETFSCQDFNRVIKAGETITFGYQMENGKLEDLEAMKLVQKNKQANDEKDYSISYRIVNEWSKHAIVEVDVYNNTDKAMEDWQVEFAYNGNITNIWNGKIISKAAGSYTIKNMDYNAVIPANGKVSFGFEVEFPSDEITCPQNGKLSSVGDGQEVESETPVETADPTPEKTETPESTEAPVATETPEETEEPQPTEPSVESGDTEDFNPEEDAYVYHDVENRDWNMEMINADADIVKNTMRNPKGAIRVALLDSGINYSDEVYVSMRENFVPGEDDYSELYEDLSGHGTAIAEVLASNPNGTPEALDEFKAEEEYTYFNDEEAIEINGDEITVEEDSLLALLDSGYEWTEGVNPTVDLISAKVLDENNETTVDRVVEAIDWAMENDTDIISMSFGMEEDSEKLHKAVKKAKDAGILIIAAAGNGNDVEYPAAYEEVMAVGSVDSMAEQADQSASGNEVEVVAPGEFIVSRGAFDSMQIFSGTSMAVPHVVGLASILWQKDTTKSPEFIRQLICATARECGDVAKYGHGLIDCEYALEKYEEFANLYETESNKLKEANLVDQIENTEGIDTDEDVRKLYGNWRPNEHRIFVSASADDKGGKFKGKWRGLKTYIEILKAGTVCADDGENAGTRKMRLNPWFHGYYGEKGSYSGKGEDYGKATIVSNYFAGYYYLYTLAENMYKTGNLKKVTPNTTAFKKNVALKNAYVGINEDITKEMIGTFTWEQINPACKAEEATIERSILLFGMALHAATDIYAHSSYSRNEKKKKVIRWSPITHKYTDSATGMKRADSTKYFEKRYKNAKRVAKAIMNKMKFDSKKNFVGYKTSKKALSVFSTPNYYNVEDHIKTSKEGNKYLSMSFFDKAYALGKADTYAKQMEELGTSDTVVMIKFKDRMSTVSKNIVQLRTKAFSVYRFVATRSKNTIGSIYDLPSGALFQKKTMATGSFVVAMSKDSSCRIAMSENNYSKRACYTLMNGKAYDESGYRINEMPDNNISLLSLASTVSESEEEDSGDMCNIHNFEYGMNDVAYRIELTWDNKEMDLDSLLVGTFLEEETFYMTYFVEKTFHPELGDVFQKDERAEIVADVRDGSASEVTKIYQVRDDGYYHFLVRNYSDSSGEALSKSGATVKLYVGNDTVPIYTAQVPEGTGYYWQPFCIVGGVGAVGIVDTITNNVFGYEP